MLRKLFCCLVVYSASLLGQVTTWQSGMFVQPVLPANLPSFCTPTGVGTAMCWYMNATDKVWHIVTSAGDVAYGVGPAGPMGPQGLVGPAGAIGPAGAAGPAGVAGPAGAAGAQGPAGPQGNTGPAGPAGPVGANGPPPSFQGPWVATTAYNLGDVTSFQGSSYASLIASNSGNEPDISPTQWTPLALAGAPGIQGAQGPPGAQGTPGVAGPTGGIGPIGPVGPAGVQGSPGTNGANGAVGPAGPAGPAGPTGPAGGSGLLIAPLRSTNTAAGQTLYGQFGYYAASSTLAMPYGGNVFPQGGTITNFCVGVWGPIQPASGALTISLVYTTQGTTAPILNSNIAVIIPPSAANGVYCDNTDSFVAPAMASVAIKIVNTATATATSIGGITAKFVGN